MILYDYLQLYETLDVDTCDNVFDMIITLSYDVSMTDEIEMKLLIELSKKVELIRCFNGAYADMIVDYTSFIKRNIKLFEQHMKTYWRDNLQYDIQKDEDDFIYTLLNDLNCALSGNYSISGIEHYLDTIKKCK